MTRFVTIATLALLVGCGSPQSTARRVTYGVAVGVAEADRVSALAYTEAAEEALRVSSTLEEYRERMEPYDGLETALRTSKAALLTAESAIDVWDAGGEERWLAAAGCLVAGLSNVVDAMAAAGVPVPVELTDAVTALRGIAEAICSEGTDG